MTHMHGEDGHRSIDQGSSNDFWPKVQNIYIDLISEFSFWWGERWKEKQRDEEKVLH